MTISISPDSPFNSSTNQESKFSDIPYHANRMKGADHIAFGKPLQNGRTPA
ncbi:hypothetical protein [Andreprevotia lacus]|jgi:hypothetical protein|uniref:hypothetical protein n=1 Tax=Andreprevotia lacus TaxID=1121000 RepID=UPI0015931941|nr:hypothetical protein [Andreprevotia lacus]